MSGKSWVPGFIELTSGRGATYWQCVAEIVQFNSGSRGDTYGSWITVRGEEEGERFVTETPEQIADLIRQEWGRRTSRGAEIHWASTRGERL